MEGFVNGMAVVSSDILGMTMGLDVGEMNGYSMGSNNGYSGGI